MAQRTELIITISAGGDVGIEVDGARGASCLDITRGLEEELGTVTRREKKRSFREQPVREEEAALAAGGRL